MYGGIAGQTIAPSFDQTTNVSDTKWCQKDVVPDDVVPSHQAPLFALQEADVDIRPRFFDNISKEWILLDTGAAVSVTKPGPNDKLDPTIRLEAVNGSAMKCYGS